MGPEATEAIAPPGEERRKRIRAAAVRADSNPAALRAARWLRSRIPGDDRFGDPLSTAGHAPVEVLGREVSALEPPRPSAAHELGLGALQLWQGLSEASGRGRGTEQVTLLFTDLVGFSSWALKAGDASAVELLRAVGAVSESAVGRGGGTIVKRLGDGVMAAFGDPPQRSKRRSRRDRDWAGSRSRVTGHACASGCTPESHGGWEATTSAWTSTLRPA